MKEAATLYSRNIRILSETVSERPSQYLDAVRYAPSKCCEYLNFAVEVSRLTLLQCQHTAEAPSRQTVTAGVLLILVVQVRAQGCVYSVRRGSVQPQMAVQGPAGLSVINKAM